MLGGVRQRRRKKAAEQIAKGRPAKTETNKLVSRQRKVFSKNKQEDRFVNELKRTSSLSSLNPSHLVVPLSPLVKREKLSKPHKLPVKRLASSNLEQGARVVPDRITRDETSDIRRKSLDSIRAKSPLAQAMLWKIILDKPLALKELDE